METRYYEVQRAIRNPLDPEMEPDIDGSLYYSLTLVLNLSATRAIVKIDATNDQHAAIQALPGVVSLGSNT